MQNILAEIEWPQLLLSISTLLGVVFGFIMSLLSFVSSRRNSGKIDRVEVKTDQGNAKVEEVHKLTNSMKDQLVEKTTIASKAEGREEQRTINEAEKAAKLAGAAEERTKTEAKS